MPAKPSAPVDTRVIYYGNNLQALPKVPEGYVDLIRVDPPFDFNRNHEVRRTGRKRQTTRRYQPIADGMIQVLFELFV